jgi:hypothetical protein
MENEIVDGPIENQARVETPAPRLICRRRLRGKMARLPLRLRNLVKSSPATSSLLRLSGAKSH